MKDFIIASVKNDSAFVARNTIDDIRLNLVGSHIVNGKQGILIELQQSRRDDVAELVINTIVTHGYNGAAEGLLKFKNGKTIAFYDVYQFHASTNNAPIKAITTYSIVLA